jgi:hypothetical protein
VVNGCVKVLDNEKEHSTKNKESFIYRVLRVSNRMNKNVETSYVTATSTVVDGCVKVLDSRYKHI